MWGLAARVGAAVGLVGAAGPGCDRETVDCGAEDVLTAADLEAGDMDGLVCAPEPATGCVALDALDATEHLYTALGLSSDTGLATGYSATAECGPARGFPGECCYALEVGQWVVGRPFTVGGVARTAPVVAAHGGDVAPALPAVDPTFAAALGAAWARVGAGEHASVASFARHALVLLGLGAPLGLVARAQAAGLDEVRHARLAFALAGALGGASVGAGPLAVADALGPVEPGAALEALLQEGCVEETLAAAEAAAAAAGAGTAALRAALGAVAEDEAAHAALAWATLRWGVETWPALRPRLGDLLARGAAAAGAAGPGADAAPGVPAAAQRAVGLLDDGARRAARAAAWAQVVLPAARALGLLPGGDRAQAEGSVDAGDRLV
jgi:hypothetical protein